MQNLYLFYYSSNERNKENINSNEYCEDDSDDYDVYYKEGYNIEDFKEDKLNNTNEEDKSHKYNENELESEEQEGFFYYQKGEYQPEMGEIITNDELSQEEDDDSDEQIRKKS